MKRVIMFAAILVFVIGCEKSPVVGHENTSLVNTEPFGSPAKYVNVFMPLKGTWDLTEYYSDNGTGDGSWVAADFAETIYFGENGKFHCTETFPLYSSQYSRYVTDNDGFVGFFRGMQNSEGSGDVYRYALELPTQLVFYPLCREGCARRYQLRKMEIE